MCMYKYISLYMYIVVYVHIHSTLLCVRLLDATRYSETGEVRQGTTLESLETALHLGKTVSNALSPISPKSFPPEFSRRQDAADLLKPSILEPHTPNHETLKPAALEN